MAIRFRPKPAPASAPEPAQSIAPPEPRIVQGMIGPIRAKDIRLSALADPTPVDKALEFQQAISAASPPWEDQNDPEALPKALQDLFDRRYPNMRLRIKKINSDPESPVWYWVKTYDPETRRASLEGPNKQNLRPVLSEREYRLYQPEWVPAA